MNPIVSILIIVGIFVAFVLVMALLNSVILLGVGKNYAKKQRQADLKKMEECLPGENCGSCGCESCAAFAQVLLDCGDPDRCVYLTDEHNAKIQAFQEERRQELEQLDERAKKAQQMENRSLVGRWHNKRRNRNKEI